MENNNTLYLALATIGAATLWWLQALFTMSWVRILAQGTPLHYQQIKIPFWAIAIICPPPLLIACTLLTLLTAAEIKNREQNQDLS